MAEQRELSGVLSRNKKREHDRQPEFKGSATIDGVAYWLSAWVKAGDDAKFFSLSFTRKEQQPKSETRPQASPQLKQKMAAPATSYGNASRMSDVGVDDRRPYRERTLDDDSVPF